MNHFLLDFLSLAAILSGILVIISKNPVISVLFLISVFVNVACYLVLLGVGFIGISYLIVYVGAIAILFLFVVMMLNLQLAELSTVGKEYTQNLPLGLLMGSLFLFEITSLLPFSYKDVGSFTISQAAVSDTDSTGLFSQTKLGFFHWITDLFSGNNNSNYDYQIFITSQDTALHSTFAKYSSMTADQSFATFHQIQAIGQTLYTTGSLWLVVASVILLLSMVGPIILSLSSPTSAR